MRNFAITINGKQYEVHLDNLPQQDEELALWVDGNRLTVYVPGARSNGDDNDWLIIDNRPYEILLDPEYHWIKTDRGFYSLEIRDRQVKTALPRSGDGRLRAPIPGLITRVMVAPGDQVEIGQPLLVLEAMKMENEIRAPHAGKVTAVNIISGQGVKLHDVLVEIE